MIMEGLNVVAPTFWGDRVPSTKMRCKVQQQPDYETPLVVKIFFAVIGVLVFLTSAM